MRRSNRFQRQWLQTKDMVLIASPPVETYAEASWLPYRVVDTLPYVPAGPRANDHFEEILAALRAEIER